MKIGRRVLSGGDAVAVKPDAAVLVPDLHAVVTAVVEDGDAGLAGARGEGDREVLEDAVEPVVMDASAGRHRDRVDRRVRMVVRDLADRRLIQFVPDEPDLAGDREGSGDAGPGIDRAAVPALHPGDHDGSSVGHLHRLRGVEVEAGVDRRDVLEVPVLERAGPVVEVSDDVDVAVAVLMPGHRLRADDDDVLVAEGDEVGTFEHDAEFGLVVPAVLEDPPGVGPVGHVRRLVQEQFGVLVGGVAVGDDHVDGPVLLPHLRVAEVGDGSVLRQQPFADHRIARILREAEAVGRRCDRLDLAAVGGPGVDEIELSAEGDRGAGEGADRLVVVFRGEGDLMVGPADEVIARHVAPVHRSPDRLIRVVLIEQMDLVAEIGEAVRIVDPAGLAGDVEQKARRSGGLPSIQFDVDVGCLDHVVVCVQSHADVGFHRMLQVRGFIVHGEVVEIQVIFRRSVGDDDRQRPADPCGQVEVDALVGFGDVRGVVERIPGADQFRAGVRIDDGYMDAAGCAAREEEGDPTRGQSERRRRQGPGAGIAAADVPVAARQIVADGIVAEFPADRKRVPGDGPAGEIARFEPVVGIPDGGGAAEGDPREQARGEREDAPHHAGSPTSEREGIDGIAPCFVTTAAPTRLA